MMDEPKSAPVQPLPMPMPSQAYVIQETKPGILTTEFWITVLAWLGGTIQMAVGLFNIRDQVVLFVLAVVTAAYNLARGLAKSGVPNPIIEPKENE